ncbi:MAG: extracellular solute-binding protein, partial [Lachnospiraceae bacterium]|nr:extracellular solute-binding protein [Lachnospiraceae bacterium]
MRKKLVSALLAMMMVTGALAGCGDTKAAPETTPAKESTETKPAETRKEESAPAAETTAEEEEITLRMAWWGSQNRHDKTIAAIELYESLHPNIKFEYEYYSFDDYFTKLKTLVASDEVWDVFQLGGNFPMYLDKIYPLDEFIASGVVDVSNISEANLKTTRDTDGTQLGLTNGI